MNSLHGTGLAFFVQRFWLMNPPDGLTKGKDVFPGLVLQVQAGFPDQITHKCCHPGQVLYLCWNKNIQYVLNMFKTISFIFAVPRCKQLNQCKDGETILFLRRAPRLCFQFNHNSILSAFSFEFFACLSCKITFFFSEHFAFVKYKMLQ